MVFALLFIFQTNYLTKFYPSFCHLVIQKCQVSNKSYFSESAVMQKSQDCQMIWSRLISPPPPLLGQTMCKMPQQCWGEGWALLVELTDTYKCKTDRKKICALGQVVTKCVFAFQYTNGNRHTL